MPSRKPPTPTRDQSAEEQQSSISSALPEHIQKMVQNLTRISDANQLCRVIDALCEEPFEAEVPDEDVAAVRAKIAQLARQYSESPHTSSNDEDEEPAEKPPL